MFQDIFWKSKTNVRYEQNKKNLVYLGQIIDGTPPKQHKNLKFWECKNANKNSQRALHKVISCKC